MAPIECKLVTLTLVPIVRGFDVEEGAETYGTQHVDKDTGKPPVPGNMFYAPQYRTEWSKYLSPCYWAKNAHRPPLQVVLPNGDWFCIDSVYIDKGELREEGWHVSGDAPVITVTPSINCVGRWHGYLTGGVLSDDVEGRVFP